jgi:hypothetical protein
MDAAGHAALVVLLGMQYYRAQRRAAVEHARARRLRQVAAALTVLRYRSRCRSRFYVKKASVTGIAGSAWRALYNSRDTHTFICVMGVSPAMFDELLTEVRLGVGVGERASIRALLLVFS